MEKSQQGEYVMFKKSLNFLAAICALLLLLPPINTRASSIMQSAYNLVEDEGTPLAKGTTLNCVGSGITCSTTGNVTELNVPGGGGGGGLTPSGFYLTDGMGNYYVTPSMFLATVPSGVSFSWVNQGTSTETASGQSLILQSNQNAISMRNVNIGSNTVLVAAEDVNFQPSQNNLGGVCVYDSISGNTEIFGVAGNGIFAYQFSNPSSFNSTIYNDSNVPFLPAVWLRVTKSGTNFTYAISVDGNSYQNLKTETGFFSNPPDQWGYCVFGNGGNPGLQNTLLSFSTIP